MDKLTNAQLYNIASDNYKILSDFCNLLQIEGYWSDAGRILNSEPEEILDIYVESLLVCFAVYINRLGREEKAFIASFSEKAREILNEYEDDKKLTDNADRFQKSAPILYQLLALRDVEKASGTAALFFDAIINIMLCMARLNGKDDALATKYLGIYFDRVSAFLSNSKYPLQSVDSKYLFKKLCFGNLLTSAQGIKDAAYDFSEYKKINLYYTSEQLRPVASVAYSSDSIERESLRDRRIKARQKPKKTYEKPEILLKKQEKKVVENDAAILAKIHDNALTEVMEELNALVGLEEVKTEIRSLINLIKVRKMREQYHLPEIEMSYHMVFTGSPGTGKTTVARIVSRIYKELGILSKGTVTETDRSGLVAGYVGQTALKVKEVVEKSLGGVLFIDEAYALVGNTSNDFGKEALDTLVKLMEDHRKDLVVIVAGYTDEMKEFLKANTGLVSRFNRFITFPDYSPIELCDILEGMAQKNGFVLEETVKESLLDYVSHMSEHAKKEFGNARGIRNLFEAMLVNQANRVVGEEICSMEELTKLKFEDISW